MNSLCPQHVFFKIEYSQNKTKTSYLLTLRMNTDPEYSGSVFSFFSYKSVFLRKMSYLLGSSTITKISSSAFFIKNCSLANFSRFSSLV